MFYVHYWEMTHRIKRGKGEITLEQKCIPKVIHYCWFGGSSLPEFAQKCIASWKKYLPDYEIKQWNESNFNLECCDYVKEAYEAKKWAFVSDYARFWILYNYGGLYFDTDVEVIKDMSDIIARGAFMGCETVDKCAPGLGLGVNPGLGLYAEILAFYNNMHFTTEVGHIPTVVEYTTSILEKHGWVGSNTISVVDGVTIYPPEFFCPYNFATGEMNITENTVSIHHYAATWHNLLDKMITAIERCDKQKHPFSFKIRRLVSLPLRVINKIKKIGFENTIKALKMRFE